MSVWLADLGRHSPPAPFSLPHLRTRGRRNRFPRYGFEPSSGSHFSGPKPPTHWFTACRGHEATAGMVHIRLLARHLRRGVSAAVFPSLGPDVAFGEAPVRADAHRARVVQCRRK